MFWSVLLALLPSLVPAQQNNTIGFSFCGDSLHFQLQPSANITFTEDLSDQSIHRFYDSLSAGDYAPIVDCLLSYRKAHQSDDWLFYQLIRKVAQQISPKAQNYNRYTLYKWFLLIKSGYDAMLTISGNRVLFYIRCDENIYNIPTRIRDNKQYVCLNYHDYANIDFQKTRFAVVDIAHPEAQGIFSYKITKLPDFPVSDYVKKDLQFVYNANEYHFTVKLSSQVETMFTNYPVVDYASYLNIPLSRETYNSLIPVLRRNVKGLSKKNGVDYLMHFTRYAFLFETDTKVFGDEKRLSPEQTLFYNQSDCEDRVALFFCLVKEIYNLPMIVLTYPNHVTIAVQFDKPVGHAIEYEGLKYSICEPTPQREDLQVGQILPELKKVKYEVAYVYRPKK